MIEITITKNQQDTTYNVPTSWDDVTVAQYMSYYNAGSVDEDNPLISLIANISILSGIDELILMDMDPLSFTQISECFDFINTEIPLRTIESITVAEEEYFLKSDFKTLTMGEIISLDMLMQQSGNDIMSCMPQMLCIFLRKKVDGELEAFHTKLMNRVDIFSTCKIAEVNSLFIFFLNGETV